MSVKLVIISIFLVCGFAFATQSLQKVYATRNSASFQCPHLIGDIAGSGQFVAALEGSSNVRIFQRVSTSNEFYNNVTSMSVDAGGYVIDTNSLFYSYLHPSGLSTLWQVSSFGYIYNVQQIWTGGIFARLLNDGSYRVVTTNSLDTYRYNSSYLWTLDNSFKFLNNSLDHQIPLFGISTTEDSFAIIDMLNNMVQLYARKAWSWYYIESVPLAADLGIPRDIVPIGNGRKTLIVSYYAPSGSPSVPSGAVVAHIKALGKWQPLIITAADLGLKPPGDLGASLLALDPNRILVSAPKTGYDEKNQVGGAVFMMSEYLDGTWHITKEFGTKDSSKILFGTGLARTDTDVIIAAGQSTAAGNTFCYLYTIPLYQII